MQRASVMTSEEAAGIWSNEAIARGTSQIAHKPQSEEEADRGSIR